MRVGVRMRISHLRLMGLVAFFALSVAEANTKQGIELWEFRLSQFSVFEKNGGNSFAVWAGWLPAYWLSQELGARLQLGAGTMKASSTSTDSLKSILDGAALGVLRLNDSWLLEAGPGMQYWLSGKTKVFSTTVGVVHHFSHPILWIIQGVSLDYTAAFQAHNFANQFRIGGVF